MTDAPATAATWPLLRMNECRVLGVLIEKAKTTPDAYPLSLNAIVVGSNQKSSRDPVLELTEDDVETALAALGEHGLVTRIQSGRVDKWRHNAYEVWQVNKVELAVLAELLLRGPQTEGELRGRASRMEPISDLDALRAVLRLLAERGLVVLLGPEGRRGTLSVHGFHSPEELTTLRSSPSLEMAAMAQTPAPPRTSTSSAELAELRSEVVSLRDSLSRVQDAVLQLTEQVRALKESLGG